MIEIILRFIVMVVLLGSGVFLILSVFDHHRPLRRGILAAVIIATTYMFLLRGVELLAWGWPFRALHYILGIVLYASIAAVLYWIFQSFIAEKRWLRYGFVILTILICAIAIFNFHKPLVVEEHVIETSLVTEEIRFVHIADTQLGSVGKAHLEKAWRTAFEQEIEFILFTGDLIDWNHYEASELAVLEESPVPIYFERGNHEFLHDENRLMEMLENISTVHLVVNKRVSYGELSLLGVDWSEEDGFLQRQLQNITVGTEYTILAYHEPIDLDVAAAAGVDLMLSGHTHAGQIWPFTWASSLAYPYGDGFHEIDGMTQYTTDGAGLWGPMMRLDSHNEIMIFTIRPQS